MEWLGGWTGVAQLATVVVTVLGAIWVFSQGLVWAFVKLGEAFRLMAQSVASEAVNDLKRNDFAHLEATVGSRMDSVDRRFDSVDRKFIAIDRRFDAVDRRFEAMEARLDSARAERKAIVAALEEVRRNVAVLVARVGAGWGDEGYRTVNRWPCGCPFRTTKPT